METERYPTSSGPHLALEVTVGVVTTRHVGPVPSFREVQNQRGVYVAVRYPRGVSSTGHDMTDSVAGVRLETVTVTETQVQGKRGEGKCYVLRVPREAARRVPPARRVNYPASPGVRGRCSCGDTGVALRSVGRGDI